MKTVHVRITLYATLLLGALTMAYVALMVPIRKCSTESCLNALEAKYVRRDLAEKEKKGLRFLMRHISANERSADRHRFRAQLGGAALFLLLCLANALALTTIKKRYGRAWAGSPPRHTR